MISKYSGRCKGCNKPYAEGEDIYWTKEDGAWCWPCRDNQKPTPEQYRIAAECGFRHLPWESLLGVHAPAADEPERDGRDARGWHGIESMPASTQGDE